MASLILNIYFYLFLYKQIAIIRVLPFLNNLKNLDPSYKTGLDFWACFGRGKLPSYKRRDTV